MTLQGMSHDNAEAFTLEEKGGKFLPNYLYALAKCLNPFALLERGCIRVIH